MRPSLGPDAHYKIAWISLALDGEIARPPEHTGLRAVLSDSSIAPRDRMGIRFELETFHRNTSDAELLADLKRVAKQLQVMTVSIVQYDRHGVFSGSTLQRRFKSWRNALELAGLKMTRNSNTSEDDLFANLMEVWVRLGRQPRMSDLTNHTSRISADTYKRRFANWRNALVTFVKWADRGGTSASDSFEQAMSAPPSRGPRDPSLRLRFRVMLRDNFKCQYCGASPATNPCVRLDVDHKRAWAEGGLTVIENLQTLCTKCNSGKSNLPV